MSVDEALRWWRRPRDQSQIGIWELFAKDSELICDNNIANQQKHVHNQETQQDKEKYIMHSLQFTFTILTTTSLFFL